MGIKIIMCLSFLHTNICNKNKGQYFVCSKSLIKSYGGKYMCKGNVNFKPYEFGYLPFRLLYKKITKIKNYAFLYCIDTIGASMILYYKICI